jgi:glycine/D-amino acid oxidase-like deaminating enzyme
MPVRKIRMVTVRMKLFIVALVRGKNFAREVYKEIRGFWPALYGVLNDTTSGYYGGTPDCSPLISIELYRSILVHAVGFSGHGAMHAPTTAFLVDAIISRYIHNHQGSLPAPFSDRPIWVGASVREWKFLETMNVSI